MDRVSKGKPSSLLGLIINYKVKKKFYNFYFQVENLVEIENARRKEEATELKARIEREKKELQEYIEKDNAAILAKVENESKALKDKLEEEGQVIKNKIEMEKEARCQCYKTFYGCKL